MGNTILAATFLAAIFSTSAAANHCRNDIDRYQSTLSDLEAERDAAEADDDDAAACESMKKIVTLEEKNASILVEGCWHDGRGAEWVEVSKVNLAMQEMLMDMTCLGLE